MARETPMTGTTVPSAAAPQPSSPAAPPRVEPLPGRVPAAEVSGTPGARKRLRDDPRVPACLVSTILHTLLLLLLALFTYREGTGAKRTLTARTWGSSDRPLASGRRSARRALARGQHHS